MTVGFRSTLSALAILPVLLVQTPVHAQDAASSPPRNPHCLMSDDAAVAPVAGTAPFIAMAGRQADGSPAIYFNPALKTSLGRKTQFFFYFHECARLVLGQDLKKKPTKDDERRADCWAVDRLVKGDEHFLDRTDVTDVETEIAGLSPTDWSRIRGGRRIVRLSRCL